MKKDSGIDSIIEKRIKDIDVFLNEIEEVNKNIPLIAKIVSDKMTESIDEGINIYETEEYKKYSIEAIRLDLLMKEANNILTEVVYILKSATILNILDISHKEEEELHLISIMSKYEYKRRDRVYQRNKYNSEEAKIKYQEKLKAEGKQTEKDKISQRRAKIKDLLAQGLKQKDICLQLNISKRTCLYDIKYLKEHRLI